MSLYSFLGPSKTENSSIPLLHGHEITTRGAAICSTSPLAGDKAPEGLPAEKQPCGLLPVS